MMRRSCRSRFLISDWLFLALLAPLLGVVALVDARAGRIPNAANAAIALLGLVRALGSGADLALERVVDGAIAGALLLALRATYHRYRGRHGLGLGDVKFLAAATIWAGLAGLPAVLLLASLAALARLAPAALLRGGIGWTTRLRFGPYLALALFLVTCVEAFASV